MVKSHFGAPVSVLGPRLLDMRTSMRILPSMLAPLTQKMRKTLTTHLIRDLRYVARMYQLINIVRRFYYDITKNIFLCNF